MILQLFINKGYYIKGKGRSFCFLGREETRPHFYIIRNLLVPKVRISASQLSKSLLYSLIAHDLNGTNRVKLIPQLTTLGDPDSRR